MDHFHGGATMQGWGDEGEQAVFEMEHWFGQFQFLIFPGETKGDGTGGFLLPIDCLLLLEWSRWSSGNLWS